jgi:hypothetical protein
MMTQIVDFNGTRPQAGQLYVPFSDYQKHVAELEAENKRLREALETTEKTYLRAFRSGIPDEIWFEYFQPLVKIVKDALDTPRA